jgi:hypothetical protein
MISSKSLPVGFWFVLAIECLKHSNVADDLGKHKEEH